jgi:tetratricopeptide (TPR) repeat protein
VGKVLRFPKEELVNTALQRALDSHQVSDALNAAKLYRQVLSLDPRNHIAHLNLGVLLFYDGEYAIAKNHFLNAVAADPKSAVAHCNLACAWTALGYSEVAIQVLQDALRLNPSLADVHFQLALIYQKADNLDGLEKALEHWKMYAKLNPSGPWRDSVNPLLKGSVVDKAPIVMLDTFFSPVQLKLF